MADQIGSQIGGDEVLDGIPPDELADLLEWRARVLGANISDKTLLATDYLNHFNEIAMLVEMVPDMPEMIEECRAWRPKGYREHFRESRLGDGELAIEAYGHVPAKFRAPFEATIAQMDAVVALTLSRLEAHASASDEARLREDCRLSVETMRRIIQVANAIIHGSSRVMHQAEIDAFLGR